MIDQSDDSVFGVGQFSVFRQLPTGKEWLFNQRMRFR
jgi:hypothetical protein